MCNLIFYNKGWIFIYHVGLQQGRYLVLVYLTPILLLGFRLLYFSSVKLGDYNVDSFRDSVFFYDRVAVIAYIHVLQRLVFVKLTFILPHHCHELQKHAQVIYLLLKYIYGCCIKTEDHNQYQYIHQHFTIYSSHG